MNKRILSIVIVLSICLPLFSLPVAAAGTEVSASYADGVVAVTGTGFTKGVSYTVRIVDTTNSSIKAMGQVTADGSGNISASITTGILGETSVYIVYVNNPNGTLAGSAAFTKPVRVKSVVLNRTTAEIKLNGKVTLIATVLPQNASNKSVVWSSANENIATVENGVVTGISEGTTVITVTTVDGGFTATCRISVTRSSSGSEDRDRDKDKSEKETTIVTPPAPPATPETPEPTAPVTGSAGHERVIVAVDAGAISITQEGNTAAVAVQEDDIAAAAQSAQQQAAAYNTAAVVSISPQLPENMNEVVFQLPGSAIASLASSGIGLQINTGTASVQLSPEILANLPSDGNINLSVRIVDPEREISTLPEGMKPAGSGIDLEFGLDSGSSGGSIIIEVTIGDDVDRDLVGLYYLNEATGELVFVGGRTEGNIVQGETVHNSKYFVMEYKKQFKDTKPNSWYSKYVDSMAAKHIMNGCPGDVFNGADNITRGEFAAALARALGLKSVPYKGQFKDVSSKDYYAEAVQNLYDKGIMTGDDKGLFNPKAEITREEIFAVIGRIVESNSSGREILQKYTDAGELSAWAVEGAVRAVANRIIIGDGNRLNPKSKLSRYEAAAILYRLYNR